MDTTRPSKPSETPYVDQASRPLALVAEHDVKIRAAVCEVLRRGGYQPVACEQGSRLLDRIKAALPTLVVVGTDMPGVDVRACLRILARNHETRTVQTIVTCPPGYDPLHVTTLKEDGASSVLMRPLSGRMILQAADAARKASEETRALLAAKRKGRPSVARRVATNASLLARKVACPLHPEPPTVFDRYLLRGGKVITESSVFDVPVYKAAVKGGDYINYHQLAVIVCPQCLFASNYAPYFIDPVDAGAHHHKLRETTRHAMMDAAARRKAMSPAIDETFFTEKRSLQQAIVSYELALSCSSILLDHARGGLPHEVMRAANYHLRLAHLHELAGSSPSAAEAHSRAALPLLEQAFMVVDGTNLCKAAYQAIAVAIHLGEDKLAYQYLSRLIEYDRDPALPNDLRGPVQRYLPRARNAWADRDRRRSPLYAAA